MGMKKTEIGMIPEEWDIQSFSDTFRILNNNTYSRAELNYAAVNSGIYITVIS